MMNRRQHLALLGFAPALLAQERVDEEHIWKEYLDWLGKQPAGDFLGLIDYRKKLGAAGMPKEVVEQYMAVISDRVFTRPEGMRLWFNTVYSTGKGFVSERPNNFLAQSVQALHPGTALDVSMGQGRNSVFLAKMGWDVTGFDVADEGLAIANKQAEREGVKIKTVLAGCQDFDLGVHRWDLVAMIYAFFPAHDKAFIGRLINSLRPNGTLVLESRLLTPAHPDPDRASLIGITAPNELLRIFERMWIVRYEEVNAIPDFGSGLAPLVRLLARAVSPVSKSAP